MTFLKSSVEYINGNYRATIVYSWWYFWKSIEVSEYFDSLEEAKDWILKKRTYDRLHISEDTKTQLSYVDAVKLYSKKNIKK